MRNVYYFRHGAEIRPACAGCQLTETGTETETEFLGVGELTSRVREEAVRLGFDLVGVADVRPSDYAAFYEQWIGAGFHGAMQYLARQDAVERRLQPPAEFRSAVVVALNYFQDSTDSEQNDRGIIARGPRTRGRPARRADGGRARGGVYRAELAPRPVVRLALRGEENDWRLEARALADGLGFGAQPF